MPKATGAAAREAKYGEKMIEVRLRFWTNGIVKESKKVQPRHAWTSGMVRMEANKAHDIGAGKSRGFHSLLDIGAVIEKVLIDNGITLHVGRQMKKYTDV